MDLGQTLFDTRSRPQIGFFPMSRDTLIHELRAIVGENYLLLEKEDVIVYEQDGSIFQVMPEIVVLPGDVTSGSGTAPTSHISVPFG